MIIINPFVGVIWVLRVKRFGFFAIRLKVTGKSQPRSGRLFTRR